MRVRKEAPIIAKAIKNIADKMARISYGTASGWGAYQLKEPKKIQKWK